ncbi:hypothetical protein A1O1_01192 [Capronia coronata CBS 617.96]|uniref:Ubiquitin-like domain-containing protein n=1 Tax=Capronia coronata CBS 617.96 TaxID=1182541 RepID=W9Z3A7_9EURO|nr:uncharacterized protein A1O1_01192 [Capronia coronata CBS 617.96]EXJ96066.1 hypothetical protein A1O1_01192 [Capronia coronata CBS 617.96]
MNKGVKRSLFTKPAWAAPATASSSSKTTLEDDASVFGRNVAYNDLVQAEQAKRERKAARARLLHAEKVRSVSPSSTKRRRISVDQDVEEGIDGGVNGGGRRGTTKRNRKRESSEESSYEPDRPATRRTPQKDQTLRKGLERQSPSPNTRSPRSLRTGHRGDDASEVNDAIGLHRYEDEDGDDLVMLTPGKRNSKRHPQQKKQTSPTKSATTTRSLPIEDEDNVSDEDDPYLLELKQKARENSRLQRRDLGHQLDPERTQSPFAPSSHSTATATAITAATTPSINTTLPRSLSSIEIQHNQSQSQSRPVSASSGLTDFGSRAAPASAPASVSASEQEREREKAEDDPRVMILIHSDIPDTGPLIVKRAASQSLRTVRQYWCERWQLDEPLRRKVFFTWRGTRLFDSTTMRGIINKLKTDHRRQQSTGLDESEGDGYGSGADDHDPSHGNIMLEATTPEIYEEKMRLKEQRQQQRQNQRFLAEEGDPDASQEAAAAGGSSTSHGHDAATAAAASSAIVIRLVSRVYDPMALRVRPHTTVGKIMRGYAATKKMDDGKTPWLIFDGERLDVDATVEQVGLEDEDEVEVSIR